jgi:peptidoglycan/LPS O-acetylase OafA/YrhL
MARAGGPSTVPPVDNDGSLDRPSHVADHETTAQAESGKERFFPGLEGLRGLAVLAVLFFHGGFDWAKGGFLGVSTFFTLSGYLITSNVLRSALSNGGLNLRSFWLRRFRRLMPAALTAILLAAIYTILAGDPLQRQNFFGDSVSSLFYVANWHLIFSGQAYADLFAQPSALLHFWSLAIEEQFYLFFPLIAFLGLVRLRWNRLQFGSALAVLFLISLVCTLGLGLSDNAIYLGTVTRMGEILVGSLLAVVLTEVRTRSVAEDRISIGPLLAGLGLFGLIVSVIAYVTVDQSSQWLYSGGLTLFSLVSLSLMLGAMTPLGPARWLLASAPLRRLGLISYGVYLYHWPIFLWLSPTNTGLSDGVLFIPRVAIAIGLASLSFRFIESPIRSGGRILDLPPVRTAGVAIACLLGISFLITSTAPPPTFDFAADEASLRNETAQSSVDSVGSRPVIALFGDSTMISIYKGLVRTSAKGGPLKTRGGAAKLGCGLVGTMEIQRQSESPHLPSEECQWKRIWSDYYAKAVSPPQICGVSFGPWDVRKHRFPGSDEWLHPGDKKYDEVLEAHVLESSDFLLSKGCRVVWITSVPTAAGKSGANAEVASHPEWQISMNETVKKAVAKRKGTVGVVDFAKWYASTPRPDATNRPDGIHFVEEVATELSDEWLSKAIFDEAMRLQKR